MESSKLMQVKRFVKDHLNLSDSAEILSFSLASTGEEVTITATIKQEVRLEGRPISLRSPKEIERDMELKVKPARKSTRRTVEAGSYSLRREFQNNAKDFGYARTILRSLRKSGKLIEGEVVEMTTYAGEFYATMSEIKRANFLNFFKRVQDRVNQKAST